MEREKEIYLESIMELVQAAFRYLETLEGINKASLEGMLELIQYSAEVLQQEVEEC